MNLGFALAAAFFLLAIFAAVVAVRRERAHEAACPKHCWCLQVWNDPGFIEACCYCGKRRGGHYEQVEGHGPGRMRWVDEA